MKKVIVWFRQDLRLNDNPALAAAALEGAVVPLYILDTEAERPMGGASRWWLHNSLKALKNSGAPLVIAKGKPLDILRDLLDKTKAQGIYWNRCYDPYTIKRDVEIKEKLPDCHSFNGSLLFEPWHVKNKQGDFFKVFTPFWKSCCSGTPPRPKVSMPHIEYATDINYGVNLVSLDLLPSNPNWAQKFDTHWMPGESGAQEALQKFLSGPIHDYDKMRNIPGVRGTSVLSPHLHFGEISPHTIWDSVKALGGVESASVKCYLSEIGWREFSYYLLYHYPELPTMPFQKKFEHMPWQKNDAYFLAWTKGETGYPIIDAGMRELWATGYMHNRVRMIVASFLTKHCMIPWQEGEGWFWNTLVDADLASNVAGWQWVAGCGADASPYFRIFNPVLQSKKFDPEGVYIKRWVPELSSFSEKYIHLPGEAPLSVQNEAGCLVGTKYPTPIVDLNVGRDNALIAYDVVKTL